MNEFNFALFFLSAFGFTALFAILWGIIEFLTGYGE